MISSISFLDDKFGIAKYSGALTLQTTNGGNKWQEMFLVNINTTRGTNYFFSSIDAASATTAYAILLGDTVYKYTRVISDVREEANEDSHLHPNPATNQISITLDDTYTTTPEIEIIDMLGFSIQVEHNISEREIRINTSILNPGVYFLRIRSGSKVETRKFVVVR